MNDRAEPAARPVMPMPTSWRWPLLVVLAVGVVAGGAAWLLYGVDGGVAGAGGVPAALGALAVLALVVAAVAGVVARQMAVAAVAPLQAVVDAAHALRQEQDVHVGTTGSAEGDAALVAIADTQANLRTRLETLRHERELQDEAVRACEQSLVRVQRLQAVGRLGGAVAHDFNNVLGVISNSLLLLQRLPTVDAHQMPLAAIERSAAHGTRLTRQLQRLAKPVTLSAAAIDLRSFLEDLLDLLKTAAGSSVRIAVELDDQVPAVRADAAELELAIVNLLLNARDAMPAGGGVTLWSRPARSDERFGLSGGPFVVLGCTDTGEGIDPAACERVFERFHTTRPGRAGLGLAQVRDLALGAGGAVFAGPGDQGRGAEIRLVLPVPSSSRDAAAPADAPAAATPSRDRLLLVEDNESLGEVTAALLGSYGYHVVRARHAADALARIAEPGVTFDVVLSDVVMPGDMDGLELAQQLRDERPGLPVVLISGYSAALSNTHDFEMLYKPYSPQDLVRLLRKAVADAQATRHA
jgi:signal transduction histidine kinase/CheY-like chemotaxis protein